VLSGLKGLTHPARKAIAAAICPSIASYAASGEDLLAWSWISRVETDVSRIRYLDIGAAHPTHLSNTFLFYRRGASGVLIEPDPDQAKRLALARPRDVVVNAGAAFNGCARLTLTKTTNPLFNSFSRERAMSVVEQSRSWHPSQRQEIVDSVEAELIPSNDLLARHFSSAPLHFLSIDVEGVDFDVLRSIDFCRFSPLLVCIEAQASIDEHLQVLGPAYRLIFQSPDNFMFGRL
jgi:FkbM family methyltransferase